ncbi:MAG TPA: ribbon-helix-helix protein, CopG family [Roseiflexaceae bacterium]
MVRTQIQLTEQQARRLKALASRRGVSMAELIRESVDMLLASPEEIDLEERKRRAIAAAGTFRSGLSDLATNHDRYLAEAYGE